MNNSYTMTDGDALKAAELLRLFKQTNWAQHRTLIDVERLLQKMDIFVAVRDQKRLIGFGRAITDGVFRAILDDIVVDDLYRGQGVGAFIVEGLLDQLRGIEEILLHTERHLEDFYAKYGFKAFQGLTMNIKTIVP